MEKLRQNGVRPVFAGKDFRQVPNNIQTDIAYDEQSRMGWLWQCCFATQGQEGATAQDELNSNKRAHAACFGNEVLMTMARIPGRAGAIYSLDSQGFCTGGINRKVGSAA